MEFQNICNEMVAPFLLRHPSLSIFVNSNKGNARKSNSYGAKTIVRIRYRYRSTSKMSDITINDY